MNYIIRKYDNKATLHFLHVYAFKLQFNIHLIVLLPLSFIYLENLSNPISATLYCQVPWNLPYLRILCLVWVSFILLFCYASNTLYGNRKLLINKPQKKQKQQQKRITFLDLKFQKILSSLILSSSTLDFDLLTSPTFWILVFPSACHTQLTMSYIGKAFPVSSKDTGSPEVVVKFTCCK